MPLPLTHRLKPVAAMIAVAHKPVPRKLLVAAVILAMVPDIDGPIGHLLGLPPKSIYG